MRGSMSTAGLLAGKSNRLRIFVIASSTDDSIPELEMFEHELFPAIRDHGRIHDIDVQATFIRPAVRNSTPRPSLTDMLNADHEGTTLVISITTQMYDQPVRYSTSRCVLRSGCSCDRH